MVRTVDTVVVGAGHAGLATSYALRRRAVDHVVLERGRIGETWLSKRWDAFRLNTPGWMNRLYGMPEPADPHAFPTAAEFVASLERYVREHSLPVETGVEIAAAERSPAGWLVRTADRTLVARNLVAASGGLNTPKVPAVAAAVRGTEQLHVADYRRPEALPPGAVLVVGGAQSGAQVTEDLLEHGRRTFLATSAVGRNPRVYRAHDRAWWAVQMGQFDERVEHVPAEKRAAAQPLVSGTRGGHTLSYQQLARDGAVLLGRLEAADGRRLRFADDLAANTAFADAASASSKRAVDAFVARHGIDAPPPEPDRADEPAAAYENGPTELDLKAEGIATVVWATGFTGSFGWLPPSALDADGQPLHRQGVSPLPGLYFVGLPWLTRRKSGVVYGAGDDAERVAELVASERLQLAA
jgi:putative flavoprotein involved in K+ transport